MNKDREYVIVCNEHKAVFPGCILFWGNLTEDNAKRSFGGYTSGLDRCERYTEKELKNSMYHFPFYNGESANEFYKISDICIKVDDLLNLPWLKTMQVVYHP